MHTHKLPFIFIDENDDDENDDRDDDSEEQGCAQYGGIINPKGNTCCLTSCGECGGSGCSGRDGGTAGCCVGTIQEEGYTCGVFQTGNSIHWNYTAPCCIGECK